MEPVYIGRRQKLTYGLVNIILGLLVYTQVPLLGQLLFGIGVIFIIQGLIRGKERIA